MSNLITKPLTLQKGTKHPHEKNKRISCVVHHGTDFYIVGLRFGERIDSVGFYDRNKEEYYEG